MTLSGKQNHALRALGHHLSPIIQIGKEGVSQSLVEAVNQALGDHELIKLKVLEGAPEDRHTVAERLAEACEAAVAQVLGRTILLFRRNEENPRIALPDMPLPRKPKAESAKKPRPKAKGAKIRRSGSRRD